MAVSPSTSPDVPGRRCNCLDPAKSSSAWRRPSRTPPARRNRPSHGRSPSRRGRWRPLVLRPASAPVRLAWRSSRLPRRLPGDHDNKAPMRDDLAIIRREEPRSRTKGRFSSPKFFLAKALAGSSTCLDGAVHGRPALEYADLVPHPGQTRPEPRQGWGTGHPHPPASCRRDYRYDAGGSTPKKYLRRKASRADT